MDTEILEESISSAGQSLKTIKKPLVAVMAFTDLRRDQRVRRQLYFLKEKYRVLAIGEEDPSIEGVNFLSSKKEKKKSFLEKSLLGTKLLSKRFEEVYWEMSTVSQLYPKLKSAFTRLQPDAIIANDIETLPLALKVSQGAKVFHDAHEFSARQFEDRLRWRLFRMGFNRYLCETYIPRADQVTVVCPGFIEEFDKAYGVTPQLMTNAPFYTSLDPIVPRKERVRLLYHGGANPSRKLENMIRMMDYLDERFTLDMYLVSCDNAYVSMLEKMAAKRRQVRILPPLPAQELIQKTNEYDVGTYILEPTNFNNHFALPNKVFEFIQSRLALAIGPSPEMARVVEKYQCGVVAESFDPPALAEKIAGLTPEKIFFFKQNSHRAAKELCAEKNKDHFLKMVETLLAK